MTSPSCGLLWPHCVQRRIGSHQTHVQWEACSHDDCRRDLIAEGNPEVINARTGGELHGCLLQPYDQLHHDFRFTTQQNYQQYFPSLRISRTAIYCSMEIKNSHHSELTPPTHPSWLVDASNKMHPTGPLFAHIIGWDFCSNPCNHKQTTKSR